MAKKLVLVKNTSGKQQNFFLEITDTLSQIRTVLIDDGFMDDNDLFIFNGASIAKKDEGEITLNILLDEDGKSSIIVGSADNGLENPDKSYDIYTKFNTKEKLDLFENIQLYRGLSVSINKGLEKTSKNCIAHWHDNQLPLYSSPTFVSQVIIDESFNKVEKSFSITNTDKVSASLKTPFGGGKSSFEHMKKNSSSSTEVKEYLTGKFLINKIDLEVEISNFQLLKNFEDEILAAAGQDNPIDQYYELVTALNNRGYYLPKKFTLGGMIYSESSTEISEYSQSEEEKKEFSAGFEAAVKGFGGGSDYSHSTTTENSSKVSNKYQNLNIMKKGGRNDKDKYAEWLQSLNPAISWDMIKVDELYPTLALLSDRRLLRFCINLLNTYNTYEHLQDIQQVIDLEKYATSIEAAVFQKNPFG